MRFPVILLALAGPPLALVLAPPPASIRHIAYSVKSTATDFTPAVLQVVVPKLGTRDWRPTSDRLLIRYERPTLPEAESVDDSSYHLIEWTRVRPAREQAVDTFDGRRNVEPHFGPPPSAVPRMFYRVRETH